MSAHTYTLYIWDGPDAGEYEYMSGADAEAHVKSLGLSEDEYEITTPCYND